MKSLIYPINLLKRQAEILKNNIEVYDRRMNNPSYSHYELYKQKQQTIIELDQILDALEKLK